MKTFLLAAIAAVTLGTATSAATITNGSFEFPGTTSGPFTTLSAGSGDLTGWDIDSGSVDLINTLWEHSDGSYSLDLDGNAPAAISQVVTGLNVGDTYQILFDMASNPSATGSTIKSLNVTVGSTVETYTFDRTGQTLADMGWVTFAFDFTATASDMRLIFASNSRSGPFGPALDNVRFASPAPVPLPAGGALLLGGFGLMALRFRHKR